MTACRALRGGRWFGSRVPLDLIGAAKCPAFLDGPTLALLSVGELLIPILRSP